jgi:hypothetical protein
VIAICAGTLRLSDPAQLSVPQPTPPTFRSAVDLVTIEASVRDKCGVPIPDLQASDFIVTIDGRPRKVVFHPGNLSRFTFRRKGVARIEGYGNDPVLAMWVPARMQEKYSGGSAATATTVATDKDFKRFQTSVKVK